MQTDYAEKHLLHDLWYLQLICKERLN